MHRTLLLLALALTLATALPGFAQDEADVDACVKAASEAAGWVLPWTLAEALELRTELDEIIQRCSDAETGEADEGGEEAAPAPSAAEDDIPRTMYVRTSAAPGQPAQQPHHHRARRCHAGPWRAGRGADVGPGRGIRRQQALVLDSYR